MPEAPQHIIRTYKVEGSASLVVGVPGRGSGILRFTALVGEIKLNLLLVGAPDRGELDVTVSLADEPPGPRLQPGLEPP